jgi:hypothetical protein
MASLSHPKLVITLVGGSSNVSVEASVKVTFTAFEKQLMKLGLRGRLHLELWGSDGTVFNGGDDDLVSFTTRTIKASGTQTFGPSTIPSFVLDEDLGTDEIYARFTLKSSEPAFNLNASIDSPIVTGSF